MTLTAVVLSEKEVKEALRVGLKQARPSLQNVVTFAPATDKGTYELLVSEGEAVEAQPAAFPQPLRDRITQLFLSFGAQCHNAAKDRNDEYPKRMAQKALDQLEQLLAGGGNGAATPLPYEQLYAVGQRNGVSSAVVEAILRDVAGGVQA